MSDLKQMFFGMLEDAVGKEGIPQLCLHQDTDGHYLYSRLDLSYSQILKETLKLRIDGAKELIFGIDRTTKHGQGTLFNDVYTCAHWQAGDDPFDGIWTIGIINYKPSTEYEEAEIHDYDWDNEFWIKQMQMEIQESDWEVHSLSEIITEKQAIKTKNPQDGRPDDLQDFELAKWSADFEEWVENDASDQMEGAKDFFLEVYIAGEWLTRELNNLTDDTKLIASQCAVAGQRTFLNSPWEAVKKVLSNFKSGNIELPGMELADRIIQENVRLGNIKVDKDSVVFNMNKDSCNE